MRTTIPKIIYGTAWKKDATTELIIQAVESGFRAIDTACQPKHYREECVGNALQILNKKGIQREDIFIQTKFTPLAGQEITSAPYNKYAKLETQVLESFEMSKKNLQTSYVDSLLLHSPIFPFSRLLNVWKKFEEFYQNGEVLHLGISNCDDIKVLDKLYTSATIKPSIVQNRFYADSNYDKDIREWCQEHNIIYQSFWTLTANPHILENKIIFKLSRKYKKSAAQILFNFLSYEGIVPLSGTTSTTHMIEDISAFDFELAVDEYNSIRELL